MGKATKKPEEKKADKPKQHAYYVCDGGTCTCAGAVSPNPVPLHVTSHKKFYILGGKKLVATDKDNGNQNLDFISCKNTSNPNNPQPCKAKIKVQWQKFYKDVTYDADKKHPLLDVSEGTCKGYTGSPVKIAIVNHGQTGHGTEKEIAEQNTSALRKLIPLLPAEEPLTKGEAPAVTAITLKANLSLNIKEVTSGKEKGKVTRVSMEIPDKDQVLNFTAAISKGTAASVSWNRYGTKKDTDTTPSFDSLLRSFIEYGTSWSIAIPKGYKGVFRVEAYGFSPHDKSCCIDIEVRPDEVLPVTGMDKGLRNVPMVFKSGYLFGNSPTDMFQFLGGGKKLHWKIMAGKEELYNSTGAFLPHAGVGVGNVFPGSLTVMFSNTGTYTITAFDSTLGSSKSFTVKILPKQGVNSIDHNPNNYLRETDTINCKIRQFNVAQSLINKSLLKWKVYYGANGAAQLAYKGELPGSAGQTAVSITPLQIQQAFHLPSVKGSYGIEAFGEDPDRSDPIKKAAGADRYVFEVRDNAVTAAPAGPLQIPSGSTGTYKAATLMEVNSAEQNAFVWQVTGGQYKIEPASNQTQEVKITFQDNAEYTITCGLMVKGVNTGSKEVKVQAAPLALHSANWCYNDGYLRTQTGYGEESYAYVELSGLKELSGKLQVWTIADGLKMEDIVKDTAKYQLLESDLKLNADENKKPPTAHGHVTFKPDKAALLPRLQAALGADSVPQFAFTITLADGNGIQFGAGIDIDKTTAFVAGGKTYYQVLATPQQYLNLTDKELLKAMYFTDTEKKRIQTGYTTYGNTHQLRVHTVNLVGQKLTVRIYRETPNALLDGTYDAKNKTIVIAEQMQEFKDVQPKPDGTLLADFLLKPEWKEQHKGEAMRVFVADVYKTAKDEQGKDILRLVMSQYNTRDFLPFEIIRNDNQQVGIKILTEEEAKGNDTLQLYKQQYLSTHNALLVVKDLAANKEPQPSPTIVYFEDLDLINKRTCYCNRDFTEAELTDMIKTITGSDKIWQGIAEACDIEDKTIKSLTVELNAMFRAYGINRCIQKISFLANLKGETGFFRQSKEEASNYDSSKSVYKGRGILQITGVKATKESKFYDEPGPYRDYGKHVGKENEIVEKPDIISTNLHYAVDVGGWLFEQKKSPTWSVPWKGDIAQYDNLREEKVKYFSKGLNKNLIELGSLIEEDEKYFWLQAKMLNGYQPKDKLTDNPIGWKDRKDAFDKLKTWFKYNKDVCDGKNINPSGRSLWMDLAIAEAKLYGGKDEMDIDDRVKVYHKQGGGKTNDEGGNLAWCASFVNYCLLQAKVSSPVSASSQCYLSSKEVEKCEVFYGAIAVFTDCDKEGNNLSSGTGHATFVYGKLPNGQYCVLGGNQNSQLKVSNYDCSGNVFFSYGSVYKYFRGFYKPKGYEIKDADKLTSSDNYASVAEANKKVMSKEIEGSTNGENSR